MCQRALGTGHPAREADTVGDLTKSYQSLSHTGLKRLKLLMPTHTQNILILWFLILCHLHNQSFLYILKT